jgi:rfaE bifunctional protein nucleotidyltransferase chain/domain
MTLEQVCARVAEERAKGRIIVTTNGCFDIIHAGHVSCIEAAKSCGDFLIVAVNTDETARRLKGRGRPINTVEERMLILAALRPVDAVCSFAEDTPAEFLRAVRPDVHVKGGDYTPDRMPERDVVAEVGARIQIVPFVGGRSTTRLLDRINELYDSGLLP